VDRDPSLVERGALNIVVVGGGPTGVEVAGALGDMVRVMLPKDYRTLDASKARICLFDLGDALLKPFSDSAHDYVAKVLGEKGVEIHLRTGVKEVASGHVDFSDGSTLATRCVVWGGGIKAAPVAAACGLAQGRGGRVDVGPDLTLAGIPGVYVIGDIANIPGADGTPLPQLGSVALQSGIWTAENIIAGLEGEPSRAFRYKDKGIMAMIGRGAAIAEVGKHHHEIHGELAHMAWLGVHASLMTGTRAKIETFVDWAWDGFSKTGGSAHVLDRGDAAEISWDDDPVVAAMAHGSEPQATGKVA
jgi:NADH dehydrogenase